MCGAVGESMTKPPGRPKGYMTDAVLVLPNGTTSAEYLGPIFCTHLHRITSDSWRKLKQTIQMELTGTIRWVSPAGHRYECTWNRSQPGIAQTRPSGMP
jgi:hypothetical protein